MKTATTQIAAGLAAFAVVQAHPRGGFQFSSPDPAWAAKRALYNLDEISDQDRKDKLTQGLKDAVKVAAKVVEKMDDDAHKDKLEFWFGDKRSGQEERKQIKQVYMNFAGDGSDETGSDKNGLVIVRSEDYWKPGDGSTPFCSIEKDGKTGTAYYKTKDKKPGMHFCDKVYDRDNLENLTKEDCSKLGEHVSTTVWSKNFIGANVLHEFMHYPRIGKDAIGEQIIDVNYDAYQCRKQATDENINEKDEKKRQYKEMTMVNADTYVWFALHIAFSEFCKKSFSGPRNENDDDDTNQDWPSSDPETDEFWDGNCNCDENSCPIESPPCCANGSCGNTPRLLR